MSLWGSLGSHGMEHGQSNRRALHAAGADDATACRAKRRAYPARSDADGMAATRQGQRRRKARQRWRQIYAAGERNGGSMRKNTDALNDAERTLVIVYL